MQFSRFTPAGYQLGARRGSDGQHYWLTLPGNIFSCQTPHQFWRDAPGMLSKSSGYVNTVNDNPVPFWGIRTWKVCRKSSGG